MSAHNIDRYSRMKLVFQVKANITSILLEMKVAAIFKNVNICFIGFFDFIS